MSQIQDESCNVMDKKSITAAVDNIEMKGRQIYYSNIKHCENRSINILYMLRLHKLKQIIDFIQLYFVLKIL